MQQNLLAHKPRAHINLCLHHDLRKRLNIAAAATGVSSQAYIRAAIIEKITREIDNDKADHLRREIQP
jgi:predicted transcriptional regulator